MYTPVRYGGKPLHKERLYYLEASFLDPTEIMWLTDPLQNSRLAPPIEQSSKRASTSPETLGEERAR